MHESTGRIARTGAQLGGGWAIAYLVGRALGWADDPEALQALTIVATGALAAAQNLAERFGVLRPRLRGGK